MKTETIPSFIWNKANFFGRTFKLSSNGYKIGFLKRKSMFSAKGRGEINGKEFLIFSSGTINKTLTIRCPGTQKNNGTIELVWIGSNNGVLKLNSGDSYYWKCIDLLKQWIATMNSIEPILNLIPIMALLDCQIY